MAEHLYKLRGSLLNLFGFFNLARHRGSLSDDGSTYALTRQIPNHSEVEFGGNGSIISPPKNATRNRGSGDTDVRFDNGNHCHFQTPRTRKRLFGKILANNPICKCFGRYDASSRRAFSPLSAELEWKLWVKNSSQTGVTTDENMAILSQTYGEICDIIGRGSSADIFLSHKVHQWHPHINCFYAIKVFRRPPRTSEAVFRSRIDPEYSIAYSLRHQNVVRTFDLLQIGSDFLCECLEYCSGGDLYSLIVATGQLGQVEANCFFKQLIRGTQYLHEMGIAHRDLKPENLLVTSKGCLKISDFGSAECFRLAWEDDIHMTRTRRGSRPYVSPEQYLNKLFDPRSVDIWAAAMIYIAMRTGRIPWKIATEDDENFRDYIEDRRIGRGYFIIDDICHVNRSSSLSMAKGG
ncbi:kinase-like domain-containing protein [Penicillium capsulatum]|uniref:non-specific serine/threonine protein kinase n=1 Tax=Penicillium capsulatum TaxID=69766 RepID=A0A9W9LL48_9EURO|nr:kinase-like domain-containing protein [Penicillium capsulatum]KAJ6116258.1 kinase-like domain-containing protein [Penicillium capsulatum]